MRVFVCVLLLVLLLLAGPAFASCPAPFSGLIHNGAYGVSDAQGKILASCNLDRSYIPASILKIPTALVALTVLGPAYRFTTRFYTDAQENLYIMGFGDPLLISEEIQQIFLALKERRVQQINSIYIDISQFALEYQVPGSEFSTRPYDAPVGPTVVNFNSLPIQVSPKRQILSSEEHTPILPLMTEMAQGYAPGRYRLNICSGGCDSEKVMARYTAELFRALQREAGIPGQGDLAIKKVPPTAKLVYEHQSSKTLEDLVSSFLRYSSNFISNLVYLTLGAEKFGYPATWAKADQAVRQELVRLVGEETTALIVHKEGAGLYRGNQVTARAMLDLLQVFRPYAYLLRKYRGVPGKSGTMRGIYNYAGYLEDGSAYVILLNQATNQRDAVLDLLKKKYPVAKKKE
jgi:D-alanyl-D-alanine carboxypeptidase/D-alanyl-D-alanine-endopeptidase (penicillin-binding protein 4)